MSRDRISSAAACPSWTCTWRPLRSACGRVLRPLCGLPAPGPGTRLRRWLDALEGDAHVRSTTSADELYLETAEVLKRCAEALAV